MTGRPDAGAVATIEGPRHREAMQIDKGQILDLLRSSGDHGKADQAERDLPQQVDTDRDQGLLERLGIDPQDLIGRLAGGAGGGLGGLLGR